MSVLRPVTAFSMHVMHIVGLCTKKQMTRIDTGRVIAPMENAQTFRNFSKMDSPTLSVGSVKSSCGGSAVPISVSSNSSRPYPAVFGLIDISPEKSALSPSTGSTTKRLRDSGVNTHTMLTASDTDIRDARFDSFRMVINSFWHIKNYNTLKGVYNA